MKDRQTRALRSLGLLCALALVLSACPSPTATEAAEKYPLPVATLAPGSYVGAKSVQLVHASASASIRYTLDGNEPSPSIGTPYSGPIAIVETTTLKALAFEDDKVSEVVALLYTIDAIAKPRLSPLPGQYGSAIAVSLSAEAGAVIRYTLDGSAPSATTGAVYDPLAKIGLSVDAVVTAIAVSGDKSSSLASGEYSIRSSASKVPRALWGEWLRFDPVNGGKEAWFFAENTLKIGAADAIAVDAATSAGTGVSVGARTIRKESEDVLSVEEGAAKYKLVKSRGESLFSATIQVPATSSAARAFLPTNPGGFDFLITLPAFPGNSITVAPDPVSGDIEFPAIPGEIVQIQPLIPDVGTPVGDPIVVVPDEPGKDAATPGDVGVVSVTDKSYSFKVGVLLSPAYMYADSQQYAIELQVSNSGSESSPSVEATLSTETGVVAIIQYQSGQTGALSRINVGTIPAAGVKTIKLTASCSRINDVFEDKYLYLDLKDADGNAWKDRVVLRFYRQKVSFNVSSLSSPVNGALITPDRKSISFFTEYSAASSLYSKSLEIPYFPNFIVGFSGATLSSETPYSLSVSRATATRAELQAFSNPLAFEGATSADTAGDLQGSAFPVAADDKLSAMLYAGDYDYFILDTGKTATPQFSVAGSDLSVGAAFDVFLSSSTPNASIYYTTDGGDPTAASNAYDAVRGIPITGTTSLRAFAVASGFSASAVSEERYNFPTNVAVSAYESLLVVDEFTRFTFSGEYEKLLAVRIAADGPYRITMSDATEGIGDTADLRLTLYKGADFAVAYTVGGATGLDALYAVPKDLTLTAGLYFIKLQSTGGQVSGTCSVKIAGL